MRIGFCTWQDPRDKRSWSGVPYYMVKALEKHCGQVIPLGPLESWFFVCGKGINKVLNVVGKRFDFEHNPFYGYDLVRKLKKKIGSQRFDFLLFAGNSELLAQCGDIPLPKVYFSDTTLKLITDYYPRYSNFIGLSRKWGSAIEQKAINNADILLFSSQWARQSAISDYHCEQEKTFFVPCGANIDAVVSFEDVLKKRLNDTAVLKLLFISVDWKRKGGDLAYETFLELMSRGIAAELTVVGCKPPKYCVHPKLTIFPYLNKNIPEQCKQFEQLFITSHFLVMPTRFECFGFVFTEAAAYGLPAIATDTGGVSDYVQDKVSGRLFSLESTAKEYADCIANIWADKALYTRFCVDARKKFETELNWDSWGVAVREIFSNKLLSKKKKLILKRPRIAFISAFDVKDRKTLSGTNYYFSVLLNKHCGDVCTIDNLRPKKFTISYFLKNIHREIALVMIKEYVRKIFLKILGKNYCWGSSPDVARYYAKQLKKRLDGNNFDLIWAEKASTEIAFIETTIPIVYDSDATFARMIDYYPEFSNLVQKDIDNGNRIEKLALDKASFFVATTQWAADSAINFYAQPKQKIAVIAHPANLEKLPSKDLILKEKGREECHLLFVGVDWQRKGGDIAVDAVNWLNQNGVKSFLTICGCSLPLKHCDNKYVHSTGFLNKAVEKHKKMLNDLYLKTHFLVLPTRAECQGQVFCEAAAYAIPIVTTNTGGISGVVKDQHSGILLGLDAKGSDFGREIKRLWENESQYDSMRHSARQFYEENLSSDKWVTAVKELIQKIL